MKIELLKTWLSHHPGKVLDLGKGQATGLLERGMAKAVAEKPVPVIVTDSAPGPAAISTPAPSQKYSSRNVRK